MLFRSLFLLSLFANWSNFGDRVELDEEGIIRYNVFARRVRKNIGTNLAWQNFRNAVLHKKKVLFLMDKKGKRHVFDSLERFEEFKDAVMSRLPTPKSDEAVETEADA